MVKTINVRNLCQGRFLPKVKWRKKDRNEKQRIGSITMWWEGCITASEWLSMLHSPSICILVNTCYIRKQLCSSSSITYSISLISCFVVHFSSSHWYIILILVRVRYKYYQEHPLHPSILPEWCINNGCLFSAQLVLFVRCKNEW